MRPIDADALKEQFRKAGKDYDHEFVIEMLSALETIDNAPTLKEDKTIQCHSMESKSYLDGFKKGYKQAILDGKTNYSRPRGKWIRKVDKVGFVSYVCSECDAEIEVEDCSDDKFCFNCGAIMREDDNEHTDPIIKAIQENNVKYDERPSIDFSRISCDLGESNEVKRKSDNLPSCNSCLHNGTWDCIKCKGFDKYEKRGGAE